ncbi:MAG TPA: aminotransferase class I/II-fold pyridoxal phosphate-dependent enzyme, partial [Candidatus Eisenbacteria bacterium]|nr:aminotransferase class I/II-fold pyridoxal phosphate-dependent enzyme [Candidatus Eisenbacteria bacterium]
GGVLWCDALAQAIAFANDYAPEHLLLAVPDPAAALARVRGAGAVFLGESSSVVFGDYATGANHTLPTGGAARAWSGLSTEQFVRWTSWQQVTPEGAGALREVAGALAELEGLPAHAAAARARMAADEPTAMVELRAPRADYARLEPYPIAPEPGPDALDLSDNTSRFGVAPAALEALRGSDAGALARYPGREADVRAALARFADVPAAFVTVGCGSDDLLDAAFRALVPPGGTIAYGVPTFSMVPRFARANGLRAVEAAPRADGALDVDALLRSGADLVYVASPDNPTGRWHARREIERLLAGPGVVVLDHAYVEFARDDLTRLALDHPRLVVTRTLSKAFALAGLRVGWAVGRLAREIDKARGPFMVSAPAERAALAALAHDVDGMRSRVVQAVATRDRFAAALAARGFAPLPSDANFVLVPVADARAAQAAFARAQVRVRAFRALPGIGDGLRITVGPWHEMERVLDALREVTPCA